MSFRSIYAHGFVRVAACTTSVAIANPAANAATILKAIGELATVGGEDMLPHKDQLMPIIIAALQDQGSSAKREAALHTLGQLASNSGYVIDPYLEYPQLLELLQGIIRVEPQRGALRQETIKLMGILGALDPYRHQVLSNYFSSSSYVWTVGGQLATEHSTMILSGMDSGFPELR